MAIGLTVTLFLGVLSGCGNGAQGSVRLETYVGQLCEAIGPFESDANRFGRVLSKYTLRLRSHGSKQAAVTVLEAVIADSRHVITTLNAVGAPDVDNGRVLAARMIAVFDEIEKSDAAWRSELRTGVWAWPTTTRAKRERVRTSVEALIEVGRQFETLPHGPETQEAMANSPVCREVFGPVRFGG
jgi:hypothetical protein